MIDYPNPTDSTHFLSEFSLCSAAEIRVGQLVYQYLLDSSREEKDPLSDTGCSATQGSIT